MANRARVKLTQKRVTRAQAVADFERKKTRYRRQQISRRALLLMGGAMLSYVAVVGAWMMHTGKLQETLAHNEKSFWEHTARLGFSVDQVTIEGRHHAAVKDVKAAIAVAQGAPILQVSLVAMKARLERIPEVDTVHITRELPNQLAVTITERIPVAWWQKDGIQQLIDNEGVVLAREKYKGKLALPVVVGEDAPQHVGELMALLGKTPSLKTDVVAAVRIGDRRWNVQLAHELVVMLPENNPDKAWQRFATLVEKEALLSKAIRSVDMRVEDRVFIMPSEQNSNPITLTSARET